jgi:2-phosphosulfolactate phosphatase
MLSVKIDFLPESAAKYRTGYTVVVVDVVRATTTAITAAFTGRRCFPVATVAEALALSALLDNPVLAGEQAGIVPQGFELNNSPATLAGLGSIERPLILLSSAGTKLCRNAAACDEAQLACLRNVEATAIDLARRTRKVVLIGAGTRGEFREEDEMCCAWIAERLLDLGYRPEDQDTLNYVKRWSGAPADSWTTGKSAAYLRRSGQLRDLEFVLTHVDDLQCAFPLRYGEVFLETVPSLKVPVAARDMISA